MSRLSYEHDVRPSIHPSVCLSVCNVGELWSHNATKSEKKTWQHRSLSWPYLCVETDPDRMWSRGPIYKISYDLS